MNRLIARKPSISMSALAPTLAWAIFCTLAHALMAKKRFDALPRSARAAIDRYSGEAFARRIAAVGDTSNMANLERVAGLASHSVTRADAATQAEARKVLEPVTVNWRRAKTT